ncbi:MAG: putative signal transducing protein [Thermoanaerobaculia bacterium]
MICPACGSEYRDGYTRCADCDVDLIDPPPPAVEPPPIALVKIYETGNAAIIPIVVSLLRSAEIDFMTKGEPIQDLFGWGRFGANQNYAIGPVEFFVREDAADEARALIETLPTEVEVSADQADDRTP